MKIEKGIEPEQFGGRTNYPFAEMEVGDSILIETGSGWKLQKRAQTAAYIHAKRHGRKFMSRMQEDGLRIWRVQ